MRSKICSLFLTTFARASFFTHTTKLSLGYVTTVFAPDGPQKNLNKSFDDGIPLRELMHTERLLRVYSVDLRAPWSPVALILGNVKHATGTVHKFRRVRRAVRKKDLTCVVSATPRNGMEKISNASPREQKMHGD